MVNVARLIRGVSKVMRLENGQPIGEVGLVVWVDVEGNTFNVKFPDKNVARCSPEDYAEVERKTSSQK